MNNKTTHKFPQIIFVEKEQQPINNHLFYADEDPKNLGNGEVGVYELKRVVTKSTKVILE